MGAAGVSHGYSQALHTIKGTVGVPHGHCTLSGSAHLVVLHIFYLFILYGVIAEHWLVPESKVKKTRPVSLVLVFSIFEV